MHDVTDQVMMITCTRNKVEHFLLGYIYNKETFHQVLKQEHTHAADLCAFVQRLMSESIFLKF